MKHPKTSVLAVLVLVACAASPSGGSPPPLNGPANGNSPGERVLGTVEFYGDPVRVEVPNSVVEQGQPFTVTVTTYGNGCVEKGETKVKVKELRAEVRSYDYDTSLVNDCDDELRLHEHTATLRFEEAGNAKVVFYGRQKDSSGFTQTSVTRTLEVR